MNVPYVKKNRNFLAKLTVEIPVAMSHLVKICFNWGFNCFVSKWIYLLSLCIMFIHHRILYTSTVTFKQENWHQTSPCVSLFFFFKNKDETVRNFRWICISSKIAAFGDVLIIGPKSSKIKEKINKRKNAPGCILGPHLAIAQRTLQYALNLDHNCFQVLQYMAHLFPE